VAGLWRVPAFGVVLGLLVAAPVLANPLGQSPSAPQAPAQPAPTVPPSTDQPTDAPAAGTPVIPPGELSRIKRALSRDRILMLDDAGFRYYVEIVAKQPTFAEYAKGYDFINGPTRRGNPMTHQEFLTMVRPRDFYSTAGIKPTEIVQMAITNWLGQTLIKQAIDEMLRARNDREREEIRARIDRELAALMAGQNKTQ
jgi:hypothetical protein